MTWSENSRILLVWLVVVSPVNLGLRTLSEHGDMGVAIADKNLVKIVFLKPHLQDPAILKSIRPCNENVTFWHVTSCHRCDTQYLGLKLTENDDNDYILMWDVDLGPYWTVLGKMAETKRYEASSMPWRDSIASWGAYLFSVTLTHDSVPRHWSNCSLGVCTSS